MNRNLLIDADVVVYNAASACEKVTHWGDGYYTWHCDFNEVVAKVDADINRLMEVFKADTNALCLTDSLGNFRKGVLPTYKGNRANVKKPLVLREIREWLISERSAYLKPTLEGDDCMGILATKVNKEPVENIIVSIDKDMKTIPCTWSRWGDGKLMTVSEAEANYWHMYQTLIGDTTDGYSGCPNIGPKTAIKIIGEYREHSNDTDWALVWKAVVAAFEKAELTEEDALQQARVARILRASDYDFVKKEPILWNPPR